MRKLLLALLMVALAASGGAQTAAGPGYYCAATGFDVNLGAGKTFRCAFRKLQRGTGTLTLNGTSTVTVSPAAFDVIVAPDALPGADGVFFNTSGLWYRLGASEYYHRISAKASSSSITVLAGAAGSANSGTTSEWAYWNTTCYRSASTAATWNVTLDHLDPRIWSTFDYLADHSADNTIPMAAQIRQIIYTPAASAGTTSASVGAKPRGMRILNSTNATMLGFSANANNANEVILQPPQGASSQSFRQDIQMVVPTTGAACYAVPCFWVAQ